MAARDEANDGYRWSGRKECSGAHIEFDGALLVTFLRSADEYITATEATRARLGSLWRTPPGSGKNSARYLAATDDTPKIEKPPPLLLGYAGFSPAGRATAHHRC